MNQNYIKPNEWSIIEEGFDPNRIKSSESLFSLGNGAMGQRANFEEDYSGNTFQGSYIAGIYYPDKTKVGWWKNGYPEYFAKVLNAPNWIGIKVIINNQTLDLNTCKEVSDFKRELDMKKGVYYRTFVATLYNDIKIQVNVTRFLSLEIEEIGVIKYTVKPINADINLTLIPYIDANVTNEDANWDEKFWEILDTEKNKSQGFIRSKTLKTNFNVCSHMQSEIYLNKKEYTINFDTIEKEGFLGFKYTTVAKKNQTATLIKYGGYCVSTNHPTENLTTASKNVLEKATSLGFNKLLKLQEKSWKKIWETSDISIIGDTKAQQGIRFNIFHLNQTYSGKDHRLNIGPKGFTGEKYGGSTYWDTEAYCLPFYMATKNQKVARNLLIYRYNHLEKAIENATKLGFSNGAALYPMVTMNGEECHNEWEITFEEIHRNGAIAFAIYNYVRYTSDFGYIPEKGLEVLIAIARFWYQRANFSEEKNKYVILGVTGPNEYENNVNNNWYTNYISRWCINYCIECIEKVKELYPNDHIRILTKTKLSNDEIEKWSNVAENIYFPFSKKYNVYLQQDGFLDKELFTVSNLDKNQRPINQNWSWDKILRSPYIKQADVLQGFYFFENHFTIEELKNHFDFYEPFTVHESSLSPCVHSILSAKLNRIDQAYNFYLQTSRLDLDDYNHEVEEGLHITSMAGTWMSIVEGFGGMRIQNNTLSFSPKIPKQWKSYSFKINYRNHIIKVTTTQTETKFELEATNNLEIIVNNKIMTIYPNKKVFSNKK